MSVLILLSALLALPVVHAHGAVRQITIGGKAYAGVVPLQDGTPAFTGSSIIRQIYSGGPITDVTSADNACGMQSKLATQVASVNPGDEVEVLWGGETLEPVSTVHYMLFRLLISLACSLGRMTLDRCSLTSHPVALKSAPSLTRPRLNGSKSHNPARPVAVGDRWFYVSLQLTFKVKAVSDDHLSQTKENLTHTICHPISLQEDISCETKL